MITTKKEGTLITILDIGSSGELEIHREHGNEVILETWEYWKQSNKESVELGKQRTKGTLKSREVWK